MSKSKDKVEDSGNHAPVAGADAVITSEDARLVVKQRTLLANDSDRDRDSLRITAVGGAVNCTVSLGCDGDVIVTPVANFSGLASFSYTVTDGHGGTSTATVTVTVDALADKPTLVVSNARGAEDSAIALDIAAALTDTDGSESLSVVIGGVPAGASLSAGRRNADGTWTLTPPQLAHLKITPPTHSDADFSLTVKAISAESSNGSTAQTVKTLHVTVDPVNHAPVAVNDTVDGMEDSRLVIPASRLLSNDTDQDGNRLSITRVGDAAHGSVALKSSGDIVFTPESGYSGVASFRYTVADGHGGTSTATVTINLANDDPVLTVQPASGNEDSAIPLNIAADFPGGEFNSIIIMGMPAGATLSAGTRAADGSWVLAPAQLAGLTLTPPANSDADFALTVKAIGRSGDDEHDGNVGHGDDDDHDGNDGHGDHDHHDDHDGTDGHPHCDGDRLTLTQTLQVRVIAVADQPSLAVADASGTAGTPIALSLAASLTDTDGSENLSIRIDGLPSDWTLSAGHAESDGTWVLTQAQLAGLTLLTPQTASGDVDLAVEAVATEQENGSTAVQPGTIHLHVAAAHHAPNAVADHASTDEDSALTLSASSLLANDTDLDAGDTLTLVSVQEAQHGTVILHGADVVFTPGTDYNGAASFTYTIRDGFGLTGTAMVNVDVHPVNDVPIAANDIASVDADASVTIDVLANDTDADAGDSRSIAYLNTTGTLGTVSVVGGQVRYDPNHAFDSVPLGQVATDTFGYTMRDAAGAASSATVTVTVNGKLPPLFTSGDDAIDFNAVAAGQYVPGTQYDAGGGADFVILPDTAAAAGAAGFELSATLHLGAGDDVAAVHPQAAQLALPSFVLHGDAGYDELRFFSADVDGTGQVATPAGTAVVDLFSHTADTGNGAHDVLYSFESIVVEGVLDITDDGTATSNRYASNAGGGTVSYVHAPGAVQIDLAAGNAIGAAGNDTLYGMAGAHGSNFDDVLRGDASANSLFGLSGNDLLLGGTGDDILDGGAGSDTASYSGATGSVTIDLAAGIASGSEGNDNLVGIENVIGGDSADTLTGDSGSNSLSGGRGNDMLSGGDGSDSFVFANGDGQDRVMDYSLGLDHLIINGVVVDENNVLAAGISSFVRADLDHDGIGDTLLRYNSDTDSILFYGMTLPNQPPELIGVGDAGDGVAEDDLGAGAYDAVNDVLVTADGKIVACGDSGDAMVLARYVSYGSLDGAFGSNGVAQAHVSASDADVGGISLARDLAGRLLQGGYMVDAQLDYNFTLVRYGADGSLDASFGNAGVVVTDFGGFDQGRSVAIQLDGKILLGGNVLSGDFGLARYDETGLLDPSFGAGGKVIVDFGQDDILASVAAQSDGKILFAGTSGGDFVLCRLNPDGSFDDSFGEHGIVVTDLGGSEYANKLVIQSDGRILLAGGSDGDFALARYESGGQLDASFGDNGLVKTDLGEDDFSRGMALTHDSRIVLGGFSLDAGGVYHFAAARYMPDGSLDASFGGDGTLVAASRNADASGVAVQRDEKIVIAGNTADVGDFVVVRIDDDGNLDPSFHFADPQAHPPLYTELGAPVRLAPNGQVFDIDLGDSSYAGTSLALVRHGGANSEDLFSAMTGGTLGALTEGADLILGGAVLGTVTANSGGTLVLNFGDSSSATGIPVSPQALTQVLQQVAYSNTSYAPDLSVKLDWTFNDGGGAGQGTGPGVNAMASTTVLITPINNTLTGTAAADHFILSRTDTGSDTIVGFTPAQGDALDIRDLLYGYNPATTDLNDFIRLRESGGDTTVVLDADGRGSMFLPAAIATLQGITGLLVEDLVANSNLLA